MDTVAKEILVDVIRFLDNNHYKDVQRVNTEAGALRFKVDRRLNYGITDIGRINETLKQLGLTNCVLLYCLSTSVLSIELKLSRIA